jgi:hypothetical protein
MVLCCVYVPLHPLAAQILEAVEGQLAADAAAITSILAAPVTAPSKALVPAGPDAALVVARLDALQENVQFVRAELARAHPLPHSLPHFPSRSHPTTRLPVHLRRDRC